MQPPWQQSLHLSGQQVVQQAFFAEVWAKALTARTIATERTANMRFMRFSLTLELRKRVARGKTACGRLGVGNVRRGLDPKDSQQEIAGWRRSGHNGYRLRKSASPGELHRERTECAQGSDLDL